MYRASRKEDPLLGGDATPITYPQIVKTFDSGTVDPESYGKVSGFNHDTDDSVYSSKIPSSRRKKVIIVGAGISGIQQATTLLRGGKVVHKDIQILDALDSFGGVWQKNTYPGCACDVPALVYTTSYYINKEYTHFFARREEIQDYYTRFALDYKLNTCTQFNSFVNTCVWDEIGMAWKVRVIDKAGNVQHWLADVLVQCVGGLDRPKFGNTPGREDFKGVSWHTAHWRHDYNLTGKNVGIIGCGPSVAQILPEIIDNAEHITVYMRTPPVCVGRGDYAFSRLFRWALRWVPLFAWFQRQKINVRMIRFGQDAATEGSELNNLLTQKAVQFMESQIKDPKLRDILRPDSKYYCKRPLYLDNFYSSLAKPHCTVLRDDLVRYTEKGVISRDKTTNKETEREFDVIIYGTGFNVANYLDHERIKGLNDLDLQDKWKEHPEALYGLATFRFPNMFMCFGPNSATVWSSQQDIWEQQARFNSKMIHEIIRREKKGRKLAIYPARDAEVKYNNEVQNRQTGRYVWTNQNCVSYYKNDAGWNTYTMPWSLLEFRWMLRKIKWQEWITMEVPTSMTESVLATTL